jgi:hypothetical protein
MQLRDANGNLVDLTTGAVVGRSAEAPVSQDPRKAGGPDQPVPDRVMGLVNNLSWGFNSALFALPDVATKGIGKALGMDEKEVTTLSGIFNRGAVAPRDAAERYARAVGEGVGASMPFTGALAWAARSRPMVQAAAPSAGVLKGIADEAVKFVQRNPALAAATDVAFSAGYETVRQAVEEQVSEDNPNKALIKELLPAAAFIGLPLAATQLPSVRAARWVSERLGPKADLGAVEKEVMDGLPKLMRMPGVRIMPQMLMKNAERKLTQVFGPIAESREAQAALKRLEEAMLDPRIAEAGLMLDVAERTMYAPLLAEKAAMLETLGPKELAATKSRINENQAKLNQLFESFAPEARTAVQDAFIQTQQQRQAFFDGILKQQRDLTDGELVRIGEVFGPSNPDMINNELRGILMAGMEMDAASRQRFLRQMGFKQATSAEGLPMDTRSEGKSLFQSADMELAVEALINKYRPERPSMRVALPTPIRTLMEFAERQTAARTRIENNMVRQLAGQAVEDQLATVGRDLPPDLVDAARSAAIAAVKGTKATVGKKRGVSLGDIATKTDAEGNITIPLIPGRKIIINPDKIRADAQLIAKAETPIDINLPEALDYLESAMRFRNESLLKYNAALQGRGASRLTDAQRYLDTGDAVLKDIESLVMENVPKINREYSTLRTIVDDYRAIYEKNLPLLMSQKSLSGGGRQYLLPNEQVLHAAFRNADNVRTMSIMLGNDARGQELLMQGTMDWLRSKKVFNKDGLVDPRKMREVIQTNRSIVDNLPEAVRARLDDEMAAAEDFVKRLGELDARRVAAGNVELDAMLAKATRLGADPAQSLEKALKDPAAMNTLMQAFGNDPEMLSALRRSVYDIATQGAQGGGALEMFLRNNRKSLEQLFKSTSHLKDLEKLADLQRRVNAFADVTGQIPEFQSVDETLKGLFGSGIQYLTTTMREAAVGRIRPETGALALLVRLVGTTENKVYNRVFTKALEDPEFAKRMTQISTPEQARQAAKQLESIGIFMPRALAVGRAAQLELVDELKQDEVPGPDAQAPALPTGIARQMLRQLPPAPPVRGTLSSPFPTQPQQQPGTRQGSVPLMYPQMFPNDPISAILLQRQQQMQGQPAQ